MINSNNKQNNTNNNNNLGEPNYSIETEDFEQQSLNSSNNISGSSASSYSSGNSSDSDQGNKKDKDQNASSSPPKKQKELALHRFFKPPHFVKKPKAIRLLALIIGLLTIVTSGTIYGFSIISNEVRDTLHYDQTEIGLAISLGDVGVYLGVTVGYFFDRFGPFYTNLLGAACYLLGYMGMWGILNGTIINSPILLAFFLFIVGQGSYASFNGTLVPNVHNFKVEHRGKISGIFVGMFALSAAIFGFIYQGTFGKTKDVQGYLLFLAILLTATSIVAAYFVRSVKIEGVVEPELETSIEKNENDENEKESLNSSTSSIKKELDTSIYNGTRTESPISIDDEDINSSNNKTNNNSNNNIKDDISNKGDMEKGKLLYNNSNNNNTDNSNHYNNNNKKNNSSYILLNNNEDLESSYSSSLALEIDSNPNYLDGKRDISGINLFKSVEFWLLFIIYFFCAGGSLMWLNNIGVMTESVKESDSVRSTLVIVFSFGNCFGRIGMGFVTDFIAKRISKYWCVVFASTVVGLTHLVTAFLLKQMLYPTTIIVGIGYGSLVSIMVHMAFVRFGARRFGFNFGVLAISSAASALIFSTVSGKIYDHLSSNEPDGKCYGNKCFQLSHLISFATNAGCILLGIFLIFYNKRLLNERKKQLTK